MSRKIHLGQTLDPATLDSLADFICGDDEERFPIYRSSSIITRFFKGAGIDIEHDGSTRKWWVLDQLTQLSAADQEKVVLGLVSPLMYKGVQEDLRKAVQNMKSILSMEGYGIAFDGPRPHIIKSNAFEADYNELADMSEPAGDESEFLGQQFPDKVVIADLGLDDTITLVLQARVDEAQSCPREKAPLATIFLLGSTLEGILLGVALRSQTDFMTAPSAPKREGKAKKIQDWKLAELIDVACQLKLLSLDVKKFSHELRDFRNYIHPYRQMSEDFSPDQHTVDICWQVFRAAFAQLKESHRQ